MNAQAHPEAHPHTETPAEFSHHVRRYLYVFYALMFGTIVTVLASYIPFGNRELNIAVALFIAVCKASLVACYFMHLISERKLIYGIMGFTAFFFLGLMALTLYAFGDFPRHTVTH
jgi:cytochrome c oxidase subunit 4